MRGTNADDSTISSTGVASAWDTDMSFSSIRRTCTVVVDPILPVKQPGGTSVVLGISAVLPWTWWPITLQLPQRHYRSRSRRSVQDAMELRAHRASPAGLWATPGAASSGCTPVLSGTRRCRTRPAVLSDIADAALDPRCCLDCRFCSRCTVSSGLPILLKMHGVVWIADSAQDARCLSRSLTPPICDLLPSSGVGGHTNLLGS